MTDHPSERPARDLDLRTSCWFTLTGGAGMTGPYALTIDRGACVLRPCDAEGNRRGRPFSATKFAAVQLIRRGAVTYGYFLDASRVTTDRFIARLEREGVRVSNVRSGLVRVVRFET